MSFAGFWPALALLLVLACLPLAAKVAKQRGWVRLPLANQVATVKSVTHVGPGQRLLTIEVRDGEHHQVLLIGATNHSLNVLDRWSAPPTTTNPPDTPTPFKLPLQEGPPT